MVRFLSEPVQENGGLTMIRLDRVYQVALEHFNMKLAGGERGLSRGVNWVHTVETENYIRFLVGNELVVITGIHISNDEDLLRFTEKIHRAGSAGIVFNTGGPILRIPRKVLEYADRNDFPVFTLPWKVHLEEFNHSLCSMIYQAEEENESFEDAMKKAVLSPAEKESFMPVLLKEGIGTGNGCGIIQNMAVSSGGSEKLDTTFMGHLFRDHCEQSVGARIKKFAVFQENECVTVLLPETDEEIMKKTAEEIQKYFPLEDRIEIYTAYGPANTSIERLPSVYHQLFVLCRMDADAKIPLRSLKETGILRILLDTEDKKTLTDYADSVLKNLEESDSRTGRRDLFLLKNYLAENGSIKASAEKCFLHRNSMTAAVKRIAGITGRNPDSLEDRRDFLTALQIRELILYL
jgi:hypothetical protein